MDGFVRRAMYIIFFSLVAIGAVVAIWEAIPGIIKVVAVIGIVVGFSKVIKTK